MFPIDFATFCECDIVIFFCVIKALFSFVSLIAYSLWCEQVDWWFTFSLNVFYGVAWLLHNSVKVTPKWKRTFVSTCRVTIHSCPEGSINPLMRVGPDEMDPSWCPVCLHLALLVTGKEMAAGPDVLATPGMVVGSVLLLVLSGNPVWGESVAIPPVPKLPTWISHSFWTHPHTC